MDVEEVRAQDGTSPSTERCRQLEARCDDLQDRVDELQLRVDALESKREMSSPIGSCSSLTAGASAHEATPLDSAMVKSSIEDPGCDADQESDALDALLVEAEALGNGVYDDDVREIINMYVVPKSPDVDEAEYRAEDEVTRELTQLLQEPAFQRSLTGKSPSGSTAAAGTTVGKLHLILGDSVAAGLRLELGTTDLVLNLAVSSEIMFRSGCVGICVSISPT